MTKTGRKNGRGGRRSRRARRRPARVALTVAAALGLAALVAVLWVRRESVPERTGISRGGSPNVLLITIDTLRANAIGAYGHAGNPTPWIDRLAAGGTRFDVARAQTPLTLPSHATILSGRYPFSHGVRDNAGFRLPASVATLPVWLHDQGYRTGAFVSAFPLDQRFGLARGFDVYDDRVGAAPRSTFLERERAATETVAHARDWLDSNDGRPSFCWVHLYEPHYPYAPPEPFASHFAGDPYEGEVAAADGALAPLVGPILDSAARARTIVILTGDHGESLGEHGEATHGIFAYDATLRVPLIVYAPRILAAGVRSDPARLVDIAPTLLDLLAIAAPADLDGRSLRQPATESSPSYFEALSGTFNRGWAPVRGIVRGSLKYIDLPIPELYDLSRDPGELHNLAPMRSDDVEKLRTTLAGFPLTAARPKIETASARERLGALGYVSGGSTLRSHYTEADDPKRLIVVDKDLQAIVSNDLAGHAADALALARKVAGAYPRMPLGWLELAQLERKRGNLQGAVDALRRASDVDPTNVEVATLLGASLTQDGHAAEAIVVLEPFAQPPDADVEILRALAIAKARTGRPDDGLQLLQRAHAADPDEAQTFVDEATIDLMADRRAQARTALEQALRRDPDFPAAHSTLAALLSDEGRRAEADAHWQAAAANDPSEYSRIFGLGMAQARAGHAAQARIALEFFVSAAPPAQYAAQIAQARGWLSAQ